MRIAIIGGGINAFCCGVRIQERFHDLNQPVEVTIIAEELSPNTTGDGSAGLWGPYLLGSTSSKKIHQWSKGMHEFLERIWLSEKAGEAGVCLLPVVRVTSGNRPLDDFWKDIVYGCQTLTQSQLDDLNRGRAKKYTSGLHFVTYTSEPIKLLPFLMRKFHGNRGTLLKKKVEDLEMFIKEHPDYDVVINCTGLGSKDMINDAKMFAVRGQVSRVRANWLYYCILDESDDGNYIIPNCESVVLGGTHQEGDYNLKVCANDKEFITKGCQELVPGLINTNHQCDWVGLRPGRSEVRLEATCKDNKIVIHNYGHGGSGVTLAWGCADDVLAMLEDAIKKHPNLQKSKL